MIYHKDFTLELINMDNIKVKLLSLWALDDKFQNPNYIDEHIISHGIWEVYGVTIDEVNNRIYTLICVAPSNDKLKIGDKRTMHEQTILHLCHEVKIVHLSKVEGYDRF